MLNRAQGEWRANNTSWPFPFTFQKTYVKSRAGSDILWRTENINNTETWHANMYTIM